MYHPNMANVFVVVVVSLAKLVRKTTANSN
jgi:hypothetical protein